MSPIPAGAPGVVSRVVVVAVLAAPLALPAGAAAGGFDRVYARSEAVAAASFSPHCERPWAYFAVPPAGMAAGDPGTAWALGGECAVRFNWNALPRLVQRPEEFCGLLVHEWGHLAGLEHSSDPGSVMYAGGPAVSRYEPCRRAFAATIDARKRRALRRRRRLERLTARVRSLSHQVRRLKRELRSR